jgi:hypothetical protein
MIDGKDHPEQIPDLVAYRLYLLAVSRSATPTEAERKSQAAHLGMIHLSDQDNQAIFPVLSSFRAQYQKLVDDFNRDAEAAQARGIALDPAQMLHARDLLVQSTHDLLKSMLSVDGWALMDAYVQLQKQFMKIPVSEGLK